MTSTYSPNKNLEEPSSGSYENAWAAPVNGNFALLDTCFGGTTSVNVTGVTGPGIVLTTSQYQPPNIEFHGTLTANLIYAVPSGVGGLWSVLNNTTGSFSLTFGVASSGISIPQGARGFVVSDGTTIALAQTLQIAFSQLIGSIANSQVPETAVQQWQYGLFIQTSQLVGTVTAAQVAGLPATQIVSGTIANARLPNPGIGPGVTIAADPGTTPSGSAGQIFYYY